MSLQNAAVSGLVGAGILTGIQESVRHLWPESAPRMDILGKRAITYSLQAADGQVPPNYALHKITLAADIVSNSAFYGLVGLGSSQNGLRNGALLGLAAGVGGVLLPGPMGLGTEPSARSPQTAAMTVGWYLLGGIAAGMTYSLLSKRSSDR